MTGTCVWIGHPASFLNKYLLIVKVNKVELSVVSCGWIVKVQRGLVIAMREG